MIVLRFDPETGRLLSGEELRPARRKRRSPEAMQRRRQKARDRLRLKWAGHQPSETRTITEAPTDHV